jgi:hypothetical protein
LQKLLSSGDHLARLASHGQRLLQLQHRLEKAIPVALRPHARIANFRLGTLFIYADNSAVAAKIRQLGTRIANELSVSGAQVTQIEVKVQGKIGVFHSPIHERPALPGEKQKQGLTKLATSLPPDAPLRKALAGLVKAVKE